MGKKGQKQMGQNGFFPDFSHAKSYQTGMCLFWSLSSSLVSVYGSYSGGGPMEDMLGREERSKTTQNGQKLFFSAQ